MEKGQDKEAQNLVEKKAAAEKESVEIMKLYKFLFNKKEYPVTLVRVIDRKTKKYLKERSHLEELLFVEMGELEEILKQYNLDRLIPIIKGENNEIRKRD